MSAATSKYLVQQIGQRDALPVRAIPYVTGWTLSPDVVAREFARRMASPFERISNTEAYHLHDGEAVKVLPKEWDSYVARLDGLEAEMRARYADDARGYAAWLDESAAILPPGVWVWLDEFVADFENAHRPERRAIVNERAGDRELKLSPLLEPRTVQMVMEGFDKLDVQRWLGVTPADRVPHFITNARPTYVSAALLALPADARVTYEDSTGGHHGSGVTNAGDYRDTIRETIARQAEGYFTLNEAAQVLADSRPGLAPVETVKRFRLAHSKGELPIHQGGSRFPLEVGETIREFWDTVSSTELDAWLRASAGYGFPHATSSASTARTAATNEPMPDRGRRVKRAALIADNRRRWPTIERDLKDAATNGLSEVAKDVGPVGWWWEGSAIEWARGRAKLQESAPGLAGTAGVIHRMKR